MAASSISHRVIILGGGFGGLYAAKALHRAPVDVTLVDRRNFHLFQPLLYQVATGSLSPGEIAAPLRSVLHRQKNTRVLLGEAVGEWRGRRNGPAAWRLEGSGGGRRRAPRQNGSHSRRARLDRAGPPQTRKHTENIHQQQQLAACFCRDVAKDVRRAIAISR